MNDTPQLCNFPVVLPQAMLMSTLSPLAREGRCQPVSLNICAL